MELSCSNIKKKSYIFSKEIFSYISGNGTLHFSPKAGKIIEIHPGKISYASGEENPKKTSNIFSKESCSYFFRNGNSKKDFNFQEAEIEITDFQMPDKAYSTIKYLPDILKIHQTSCLVIL